MVNRRRSGAFQPLLEENDLGRISLATKETDIDSSLALYFTC